jgi:hypothetical protein
MCRSDTEITQTPGRNARNVKMKGESTPRRMRAEERTDFIAEIPTIVR